jgi:hypothetical protein
LCQITFPLEVQALQRVKNIWLRELIAALQLFYVDASFCSVFKEHLFFLKRLFHINTFIFYCQVFFLLTSFRNSLGCDDVS